MRAARRFALAAGLAAALLTSFARAQGNSASERYYRLDDFRRVTKIDAHMHVHGAAEHLLAAARRDNFRILTLNVDYPDFPPLAEQLADAIALKQRYPGRVAFAGTFSVVGFNEPGWTEKAQQQIDAALAGGAVGIKIWKNIGMALKDRDGRYVLPDDARLEPIYSRLEREHVVLLGHQAEPLNCWLPFEKMTVRSDREYFREHPQYYMAAHPEMPSHQSILAARDRMLKAHPALRFEGVHLASLEWDVDRVANFLDRFPDARVDVAARMVHLEYQAVSRRSKVQRFLIRYQDRILYGSDDAYGAQEDTETAAAQVHEDWLRDWRFLVSAGRLHSEDFALSFRGLHLPKAVVDKIYRRNAEALFGPDAWH